ncbi:MAG: hypothetical protein JWP69_435 [Flaviaesturariibacter sp.]|nr:hypothetical protein [Flaviaesturariibacter sp.]
MKRLLFVCGLLLSALFSFAQTDTLRQELNYLFGNLSPSAIPSGYLAPYGMDMAQRQRFNGALTESNVINGNP